MAAAYFVDTSALCKRYVAVSGSTWLRGTVDPSTGCEVVIVRTTAVEMISAITRRERERSIIPADAIKARTEFKSDLATDYQVVELSSALADRAMDLAEKHTLRGFDVIQLSAALESNGMRLAASLSAITLLSSDSDLNTAAMAEGLTVDDPNTHP